MIPIYSWYDGVYTISQNINKNKITAPELINGFNKLIGYKIDILNQLYVYKPATNMWKPKIKQNLNFSNLKILRYGFLKNIMRIYMLLQYRTLMK